MDSAPKDFEVEIAQTLEEIPGFELDHPADQTGKKAQNFYNADIRPDIVGEYYGRRVVVDTKLYDNSAIKSRDVEKLLRDSQLLGEIECLCPALNVHILCMMAPSHMS